MTANISNITNVKFDALLFIREIWLPLYWEEIEWFEAYGRKLLAVIAKHHEDNDYCFAIFARDERRVFRLHKVAPKMFETKQKAWAALMIILEPYQYDKKEFYEKSPIKKKELELFKPIVREEKQHNFFKLLLNSKHFVPARNLIEECAYTFFDVDGNFIKDFQSTEFNSRLWELFLHVYLKKNGFKANVGYSVPDFCLDYYGDSLSIEAVTVNANADYDEPAPKTNLEAYSLSLDYMPIKYHSTLTRKLQKKYYELQHVKGNPLVFAIHDYHDPGTSKELGSMTWTRDALPDYLYGYRQKATIRSGFIDYDSQISDDRPLPIFEKIEGHVWKGRRAPSGFFLLSDSDYVSAVMFSNGATLGMFNRMGKLAGLGGEDLSIVRYSRAFDSKKRQFIDRMVNVDDPLYLEDWGDSIAFYHNPYAKFPLDPDIFPNATHFCFDYETKQLNVIIAHNYTISSYSLNIVKKNTK